MRRNKEQQPEQQEITVDKLLSILQGTVESNQKLIQEIASADSDSRYKVRAWIEDGVARYSITKKRLMGFRR